MLSGLWGLYRVSKRTIGNMLEFSKKNCPILGGAQLEQRGHLGFPELAGQSNFK